MWQMRTTVPMHHFLPFPDGGSGEGGVGAPTATGGTGQQGGNDGGQQGGATGGTGQGQQGGQGQGQQGQQGTGQSGQGQQTGGTGQGQKIEDLPDWAQKLIRDTRAEAASARTSAKTTAAQEAQQELMRTLGKALGFVKDEPLDPAKLAEDLQAKGSLLKETQVQLAVLRAAGKAGGDPEALLDSRAFLTKLKDLDPSVDGFADQVQAAIAQAVKDNPRLAMGTPVGSGGGQIDGGTNDPGASAAGSAGSMEEVLRRVRTNRNRH